MGSPYHLTRTIIVSRTLFVPDSSPSPSALQPLPLRRAWLVLLVVVIADVMDFIDSSIANVAGPSIRADLGGDESTLQWVLSAYTAAFAIGLVTSGRLGTRTTDSRGAASAGAVMPAPISSRARAKPNRKGRGAV